MRRTLIKSAVIISMDDAIGDLNTGDVLVEGEPHRRRAPIDRPRQRRSRDRDRRRHRPHRHPRPDQRAYAHLADRHCAAMPQTGRCWNISAACMPGSRRVFRPDDIYIATLVGALNQINCGTTTLVDWCHNNPTPDHTDAAVRGLIDSGIRAAFFHGSPKPEPKPGEPHFSEDPASAPRGRAAAGGALADRDRPRHPWACDSRPALFDARRRDARLPPGARAQPDRIDASGRRSRQDAGRLGEADRSRPRRCRHQHRPWQRSARRSPDIAWSISAYPSR